MNLISSVGILIFNLLRHCTRLIRANCGGKHSSSVNRERVIFVGRLEQCVSSQRSRPSPLCGFYGMNEPTPARARCRLAKQLLVITLLCYFRILTNSIEQH